MDSPATVKCCSVYFGVCLDAVDRVCPMERTTIELPLVVVSLAFPSLAADFPSHCFSNVAIHFELIAAIEAVVVVVVAVVD